MKKVALVIVLALLSIFSYASTVDTTNNKSVVSEWNKLKSHSEFRVETSDGEDILLDVFYFENKVVKVVSKYAKGTDIIYYNLEGGTICFVSYTETQKTEMYFENANLEVLSINEHVHHYEILEHIEDVELFYSQFF